MASPRNHAAYDSRPPPSRRAESFSRPTRTDGYLRPSAGPYDSGPSQGYGGERRSGGPDSPSTSYPNSRPSNRSSYDARYDSRYDPRYSYPPRRSPSRVRKRRSWPPQPCVEDEVTSLRKEAGTERLLRQVGREEVVSRGSIDQEPILEDVSELANKDHKRHVPKPKDSSSSTGGLPTPPSSGDERQRREGRRPSRLNMDFKTLDNFVPEMRKRTSTPYSFTRSAQTPQPQPADSRFLSPDVISPPKGERRAPGSKSQPASPRRDSARYSPSTKQGNDYFAAGYAGYSGDESAIDDTAYDTSDSISSATSSRQRPTTYPRPRDNKSDEPKASPVTSVVDFAAQPKDTPIRKAHLDARRNTDTANTLPTLAKLGNQKSRRPTPLAAASALSELSDSAVYSSPSSPRLPSEVPLPRSREPSYASSRGPSPTRVSESRASGASPRFSAEFSREQSSTSSPASKAPSLDGSRPASPSPRTPGDSPRLPRTDLDWSALMAANAARRPRNSSRLATSQLQMPQMPNLPEDSRPEISRSHSTAPPIRAGTMPPSMHEGSSTPNAYMPSERTPQYFPESVDTSRPRTIPEKRATLQAPLSAEAKSTPYGTPSYGQPNDSARLSRPAMPTRHSTADLPQVEHRQEPERPGTSDSKRSSYSNTSYGKSAPRKEDLQALLRRKIPSCRRPEPVAGYDDWYTLSGAPNLDVCPDCVRENFDGTRYHREIRRSPRYNREARIQCAMGQPWIRLAFLLTLQRERSDLVYLKDLAEIDRTTSACPGNQEDYGPWYGLRDSDNFFIRNYCVCYADVRKIERLFSSLSGQFVRQPERYSHSAYRCAMRPETNRFWPYLSTLASIHEQSVSARKQADIAPFIDFVDQKMRSPECTRDTFLTGGLWHFIPNLPEFTVCRECFESIVVPEMQRHRDLAMRFNHSVQPVPQERGGSSCMLYSRRTRRWFRDAIDDNDMKYLAQRARARRDKEVYLQDKYKDVQRRMTGLTGEQREELRRLEREVQWIAEEWQKVE